MDDRELYYFVHEIMTNPFSFDRTKPLSIEKRLEKTKDIKIRLRAKNKQVNEYHRTTYIYGKDNEGYIEKEVYDCVFDNDDIIEYKALNRIYINSPYDCTGRLFTSWIKVFPLPMANKTIVYHCKTLDV